MLVNNMNAQKNMSNEVKYASEPLKAGDRVGLRIHTDIDPGTVIRATASTAWVKVHSFKLINGPKSGEADAMTVSVGGFCAHWDGTPRYEIDWASDCGTVKVTFRKGDKLNGVTGLWRRAGYDGGLGKLGGVVYLGEIANYDNNF